MAPVGTLADFLEVDGKYESVVDEFLRDELNYIVVKSWDAADAGMHLLQTDVAGRATFLVHPNDAQANFSFAEGMTSEAVRNTANIEGVVPLRECVRVLDGFGKSLEVILPKLREGFVAPDSYTARSLALSNPHAFFLSPTGETFHNVTVTGGRPRAQGPLALKRELTEVQQKIEQAEQAACRRLTSRHRGPPASDRRSQRRDRSKTNERRDAEREVRELRRCTAPDGVRDGTHRAPAAGVVACHRAQPRCPQPEDRPHRPPPAGGRRLRGRALRP